ncbi:hypothetical protein [Streptomyces longwoodensis]|uniref:hypothetical protein n=2 Tax=Streptomyces longwoodensis TaxID=68231 RepID=UPI002258770E|nr:hypothetical protein [Streptomyces longwoodensis]MCX5000777.1 hypothetical protein [Streptomyces longwoodensis]
MNQLRRLPGAAASLAALCAGLPAWVYMTGIIAAAGIYICRLVLVYRFATRALERVQPAHIPSLLNALAGRTDAGTLRR